MRLTLPLLLLVILLVVLVVRRRRRPAHRHAAVGRTVVARTASHAETVTDPAAVLEAVTQSLVEHRPPGNPPRRYVVRHRDPRAVELALRLVEDRGTGPLLTVLVEADPTPDGAAVRFEVLDITPVDGILDRLREVVRTRDAVLATVTRLDPGARFRDELLPLPEDAEHAEHEGAEHDRGQTPAP